LFCHLGAGPVEYRHEVVTNDLDPRVCTVADVLLKVGNQTVTRGLAKLDVFMHGNALDHFKLQAAAFNALTQGVELAHGPDFAHRHVIDRGNNAIHTGNLADVFQLDRVGFTIPAERHLHGVAPET
jgi:hypothetical protein